MTALNMTHDPKRQSWVAAANQAGCDFPLQNLPFGIFKLANQPARGGVAIGDQIFDLQAGIAAGLFSGEALTAAKAACASTLNDLMALGNGPASALRLALSTLLGADSPDRERLQARANELLIPMSAVTMQVPARIAQFTDMSASSFHIGRSRGNDEDGNPIVNPVFKWQPVGYNGRASSIVISGTPVRRPNGQWAVDPKDDQAPPGFGPEPRQDYEMELAMWFGGPGNTLGEPIAIGEADKHIFGFSVINDWSARRIQVRESVMGPFLSKSNATTTSPWIVTAEALAPFRIAAFTRPPKAPAPLRYLLNEQDQLTGGIDLEMESFVVTEKMRQQHATPFRICSTNYKYMYWTWAQILAQHTICGCNFNAGDVIGSGTVSGPSLDQAACLSEKTRGATIPWTLDNGETRTYLEDGDEVICRAKAKRDGYISIGFGECVGQLLPAPPVPV